MEWLAKATDLLDKVDQLAAERLADEEDAEVADEDVLALLDAAEREEEPAAHAPAGDAAAAAATEAAAGPPPSPRGELQRCAICGGAAPPRVRACARWICAVCVRLCYVRALRPCHPPLAARR